MSCWWRPLDSSRFFFHRLIMNVSGRRWWWLTFFVRSNLWRWLMNNFSLWFNLVFLLIILLMMYDFFASYWRRWRIIEILFWSWCLSFSRWLWHILIRRKSSCIVFFSSLGSGWRWWIHSTLFLFGRKDIFLRFRMMSLRYLLNFRFFLHFLRLHGGKYNISNLNITPILLKFFGSADKIVKHFIIVGQLIAKRVCDTFFSELDGYEHGLS